MKHTTLLTMAALSLGVAGLQAQEAVTKPVGFVTHTLKAGQFNLVGLTLHNPINVSGVLESAVTNDNGTAGDTSDDFSVLTDSQVNFTTSLTAGKTYILEITENPSDTSVVGAIQEITTWSGNTITTPDDLSAGLNHQTKYQLRAATALRDVFGANNEAALQEGPVGSADIIWVTKSSGQGYDKYYYHPGSTFPQVVDEGWKALSGADAPAEIPLAYTDSLYVERRGSTDLDLIVTGSVITHSVSVAVVGKHTLVSSVFPVGSTLANSGLEDSMQKGPSGSADLLWIPKAVTDPGEKISYDKYFYHPGSTFPTSVTAGWKKLDESESVDVSATPLKSGMVIEKRAAQPYQANIKPPTSYSNL